MIHINKNNEICFYGKKREFHRINGPAFIYENYQAWLQYDILHRIDGPAVIDGDKRYWYIEEVKYTESEYHDKLKEMGLE